MELDQLRAFVAVAEAGGFTRAAQGLASTQPTLSRQVGALEREFGERLFDRLGRRVSLTPAGQELVKRAHALLVQADALMAGGHRATGRLRGRLRLGVADSVVLSRFPPVLRRFKQRYRDVQVHIKTGASPDILGWVRDGRCDAGLCMLPGAHPGLTLRPLWDDHFVAIAPARHALAGKRATLTEFASGPQIMITPRSLSHQVLTAAYQSEGLTLVPAMDFDNFHLIAEFVATGVGVGVCSATVAAPLLRAKKVARVRIPAIDRLSRRLGLVLGADRGPTPPVAALMAEIDRSLEQRAAPRRRTGAGATRKRKRSG